MPRSAWTDHLQSYSFWLGDMAPVSALALPVFTPSLGFSSVSLPSIDLSFKEIKQGNKAFPTKYVMDGSVGGVTLSRGSVAYDSDFYRWMMAAVRGTTQGLFPGGVALGGPTYRRDLLLVQFYPHAPISQIAQGIAFGAVVSTAAAAMNAGSFEAAGTAAFLAGGQAALAGFTAGESFNLRMPAKAWMLRGCIPKSYKPGGDLDADSGEVTVQTLELELEEFDEIALGA